MEYEKSNTKLRDCEISLKKFEYKKALDQAILTNDPSVILSMVRELSMRNGLKIALAGRTPEQLEGVMGFIINNIRKARYQSEIVDLADCVIDLYSTAVGVSKVYDGLCRRLLQQVEGEYKLCETIMGIKGELDLIIGVSQ